MQTPDCSCCVMGVMARCNAASWDVTDRCAEPPMSRLPPFAIEHFATPMAWADADGVLQGCNDAFARWLDAGAWRVVGMPLDHLDDERPRLAELWARLPAVGDEPLAARRVRLKLPTGLERRADLWFTCQPAGVLIEAHPLDDQHDERLAQLPDAMHAALQGLAHEVRNPLAGLRGAAQLLARRSLGDEDAQRYVGVMLHECDRLGALVDRLLSPASGARSTVVNVHQVLERVRLLAEAAAQQEGGACLLRDYDPSLPELAADADRLTQAIWNLVRNALEAGAQRVHLRTRAERNVLIGTHAHRLAVRVDVEDDGRGVPEELAERIFLPLVSGRADGTGLGLTLVQQVAREHGGQVSCRSRPGHTRFTLLLPIR